MNIKLQKLFVQLENDRNLLLAQIEKLTPEQFQKSVNGKWSIQQILTHLWISEKLSLQYMLKKAKGIKEAENTGVIEGLKMMLLTISLRLPIKFKAPRGINEITPAGMNLSEIKLAWARERNELKTFLERVDDDQLRKKIFRQPRVGLINIQQTLVFFRDHYVHHLPQIKKLIP